MSDLHITTGKPPVVRVSGHMVRLQSKSLEPKIPWLALRVSPETNEQELREGERTLSLAFGGPARFRVAVSSERGHVGMVLRRLRTNS